MHLVGGATELLALLELLDDVRIAGRRDEGREPVEARDDRVLDFASRYMARPANDAGNAEAAFERRSFTTRKRGLSAVRPGEVLGTVVCAERDDGVVLEAIVLEVLHHRANDVVELRHAGFLDGPAVLRRTHM